MIKGALIVDDLNSPIHHVNICNDSFIVYQKGALEGLEVDLARYNYYRIVDLIYNDTHEMLIDDIFSRFNDYNSKFTVKHKLIVYCGFLHLYTLKKADFYNAHPTDLMSTEAIVEDKKMVFQLIKYYKYLKNSKN